VVKNWLKLTRKHGKQLILPRRCGTLSTVAAPPLPRETWSPFHTRRLLQLVMLHITTGWQQWRWRLTNRYECAYWYSCVACSATAWREPRGR